MIHYNVCNDRDKYRAILWVGGHYCGPVDLANPLAHQAIGFKSYVHTLPWCSNES